MARLDWLDTLTRTMKGQVPNVKTGRSQLIRFGTIRKLDRFSPQAHFAAFQ